MSSFQRLETEHPHIGDRTGTVGKRISKRFLMKLKPCLPLIAEYLNGEDVGRFSNTELASSSSTAVRVLV